MDNLSCNTIQKKLLPYQNKINAAVAAKDLGVEKHKEALEDFQEELVYRHRIGKARAEHRTECKLHLGNK